MKAALICGSLIILADCAGMLYFAQVASDESDGRMAAIAQLAIQDKDLRREEQIISMLQEKVQDLQDDLESCRDNRQCDE